MTRSASVSLLSAFGPGFLLLWISFNIPAYGQSPPLGPADMIEPVAAEAGARNDHPARLDPMRLFEAMISLEVEIQPKGMFRRDREIRRATIFTEEQLEQLVPNLVEAFARLDADHELGVSVSQSRRANEIGFLSGARTTSARLFHQDGELHMIFGQVEKDVSLERDRPGRAVPNAPASLGLDRGIGLLESIGSRSRPTTLDWRPALPNGARLVEPPRKDWIAVRPDAFQATAQQKQPASTRARRGDEPTEPAPSVPDAANEQTRPEVHRQEADRADQRQANPSPRTSDPTEQKLRTLKRYRDQGLISEQLYQEKVRELIDSALQDDG